MHGFGRFYFTFEMCFSLNVWTTSEHLYLFIIPSTLLDIGNYCSFSLNKGVVLSVLVAKSILITKFFVVKFHHVEVLNDSSMNLWKSDLYLLRT